MTLRCFIGLPLPASYQQELELLISTWRERLRSRITWTKPGNWHLTLFFLGDVAEEQLEGIKQRLAGVRSPCFQLQAAGGGFFPPGKAPRVIWVGLAQGGKQAGDLAAAIAEALQPLGYEPEKRPFRAHLTVARVKQDRRDDWKALLADMQQISWPAVQVPSFVLWKSHLRPEGPEYTRLAEYALAEAPGSRPA